LNEKARGSDEKCASAHGAETELEAQKAMAMSSQKGHRLAGPSQGVGGGNLAGWNRQYMRMILI
jgi:hypothetical protein